MTKQDIRQLMRQRKASCSPAERARLSQAVVQRLMLTAAWQRSHTVLLYHSLPDEVDTHELLRQAVAEGKRVLLPVVVGDDLELRPFHATEELQEGAFHILEPSGAAVQNLTDIDLAIIPGVAFTPQGQRLGRGRGYYDRLLPRLTQAHKTGLCWPFQLVETIPSEPHDIIMDEVISLPPSL